ncbi:MAG: metallophosphoesterase [Planctomycetes bacterium]|nr:metallophosphoesterase [Planctomycetota bacterium]
MSQPAPGLRLAHISDLHIARRPVSGEMNLKRFLGFCNYRLIRQRRYQEWVAAEAIAKLIESRPNVVLLTGDITQLGLDSEFHAAEMLLSPLTDAGIPVVAVAGNHDIYGEQSRLRFEAFRQRVMLDLREDKHGLIRLPGVDILPLEQGIPSPPFFSNGRQGMEELAEAHQEWQTSSDDRLRIAAGHYPVIDPHGGRLMFLHGLKELQVLADFCRDNQVAAYFCGHNHRRFSATMPGGCVQYSAPALSDVRWVGFEKASIYDCRPGPGGGVFEAK